ncbi:MAG: Crp/Fnr family transcriptional regulator [Oscillospiraceae bacterium]|nr:Crp/Fnr family transcriptional regulator [Oscillospiraceae bacterium]
MTKKAMIEEIGSPLFEGIASQDRQSILGCTGYRIREYGKGEIVSFEEETIRHIGILITGAVDMVKEDLWGNQTMLVRMKQGEVFGETFACGSDSTSSVTFLASEEAKILFIPFQRVMRTCTMACAFHQQLSENMMRIMADKNRDLMRKVEIVSKRTIRDKIMAYLSIQGQLQRSRYFDIPLGRLELADYLCVDRSALTRELAKMKEEGLIDFHKNSFRML